MSSVLKVSEAAAMGLHAIVLLATHRDRLLSNHEIASELNVSEAHLSKVLQRLVRAGLVESTRGPGGGFRLADGSDQITLLNVYEALEGPLRPSDCMLSTSLCGGKNCILGGLLAKLNHEVHDYLSNTRVADVTPVFGSAK